MAVARLVGAAGWSAAGRAAWEGPVPVVRLIEADQAPLLARRHYAGGDPGPLVGALAHVPELLEIAHVDARQPQHARAVPVDERDERPLVSATERPE
jgi:hypothetical protein